MNRAWIPAGALASVSVAGLIALGPLTDSMGTSVSFPTKIPVIQSSVSQPSVVPVSVSSGTVGNTKTAAFKPRGGRAGAPTPTTNSDIGYVADHTAASTTHTVVPAKHTIVKPKKVVHRQTSIGTTGEQNDDTGLAGGSGGQRRVGQQASTPGSNGH